MRTPVARLRAIIMAGQIAVACILLVGAGLLGRSVQSLINIDRGYQPGNLLTARLPLPSGSTYEKTGAMLRAIDDRLQALPGVTQASFGNALPLVSAGSLTGLNVRLPRDPSTLAKVQSLHRTVDPDVFRDDGPAAARRPPPHRQRYARRRSRSWSSTSRSPISILVTIRLDAGCRYRSIDRPSGRSSASSTT